MWLVAGMVRDAFMLAGRVEVYIANYGMPIAECVDTKTSKLPLFTDKFSSCFDKS